MSIHFIRFALPLLTLAFLAGCGKSRDTGTGAIPINVEAARPMPAGEAEEPAYSGTIEPSETIPLGFSMPGTVARVLVTEGQAVRKGQLLATLNNDTYKNTSEISLAAESRAEDAYRRLEPMHRNGTIPEIKFVEVKTGLAQARAASAIARKNQEDCNLVASTDGCIGRRGMDPGMVAVPGVSTITIVKIRRVYACISVAERDIPTVRTGQTASVTIDALGAGTFSGTVEEIGVMADPLAHTYRVRVAITNSDNAIRPGMVCNVVLHVPHDGAGPGIPPSAVLVDEIGGQYVYCVDPATNIAEMRRVRTGRLLNRNVEILDGLKGDELIVTAGQHKLYPHAPVRIVNP